MPHESSRRATARRCTRCGGWCACLPNVNAYVYEATRDGWVHVVMTQRDHEPIGPGVTCAACEGVIVTTPQGRRHVVIARGSHTPVPVR